MGTGLLTLQGGGTRRDSYGLREEGGGVKVRLLAGKAFTQPHIELGYSQTLARGACLQLRVGDCSEVGVWVSILPPKPWGSLPLHSLTGLSKTEVS